MSPSVTKHYKIHGLGISGPLVALVLLLLAAGLLGATMRMREQEPKVKRTGPKYKDEEE
jgi:hypothetical protein